MLQMIIAGYILSIYQFMVEERGQFGFGFTPVHRRGTSSQTQVSISSRCLGVFLSM